MFSPVFVKISTKSSEYLVRLVAKFKEHGSRQRAKQREQLGSQSDFE